jgi:hypothetical protein
MPETITTTSTLAQGLSVDLEGGPRDRSTSTPCLCGNAAQCDKQVNVATVRALVSRQVELILQDNMGLSSVPVPQRIRAYRRIELFLARKGFRFSGAEGFTGSNTPLSSEARNDSREIR